MLCNVNCLLNDGNNVLIGGVLPVTVLPVHVVQQDSVWGGISITC